MFIRALVAERVAACAAARRRCAASSSVSRDLLVRGAAFQACFLSAAAVAARFGAAALGGAPDRPAAVDVLRARPRRGGDRGPVAGRRRARAPATPDAARRTAVRIGRIGGGCGLGFAVVIGAGAFVLPGLFTPDPAVRAQALVAWPWFVGMQPIAGVVFALDGVLIGAGDVRFMRNLTLVAALGFFLPADLAGATLARPRPRRRLGRPDACSSWSGWSACWPGSGDELGGGRRGAVDRNR